MVTTIAAGESRKKVLTLAENFAFDTIEINKFTILFLGAPKYPSGTYFFFSATSPFGSYYKMNIFPSSSHLLLCGISCVLSNPQQPHKFICFVFLDSGKRRTILFSILDQVREVGD